MTSFTVSLEATMWWNETPRNPDPSGETPASLAAASRGWRAREDDPSSPSSVGHDAHCL
jgi:hypothetical protein